MLPITRPRATDTPPKLNDVPPVWLSGTSASGVPVCSSQAATNPAVEQQGQLVAHRGLDRRQHVERAGCLVELTPAMIGHQDPVATDVERA